MAKPSLTCLAKFEHKFVRPAKGRTLIVGSHVYEGKEDRRARYADAVGVDMLPGPGVDVVCDLEEEFADYTFLTPDSLGIGTFAHIECMSVLEHSRRPWLLAANLERLLQPGGTIYVTVPFIWRFHGYPSDYFRFTREGIASLFPAIEWSKLMYASDRLVEGPRSGRALVNGHPYLSRTETVGFGVKR